MNILVSNDDGFQSEGIRTLVEALSKKGDVYLFAPDGQRSASSHALSITGKIEVTEIDFPCTKKAWKSSGTPADCVKVGLEHMRQLGIETDIVYAGINHGANLGTDVNYSGTVSAAAEGMFAGLPAVAVSVDGHGATHFEGAAELAVKVFDYALELRGKNTVVNINTPDCPMDQIKGVKCAILGEAIYDDWLKKAETKCDGTIVYEYAGAMAVQESDEDIDVKLVQDGYATISALKYDLNNYGLLNEMKKWNIEL